MNRRVWRRILKDTKGSAQWVFRRRRQKTREVRTSLIDLFKSNPSMKISLKGLCYKILGNATAEDQIIIENAIKWVRKHTGIQIFRDSETHAYFLVSRINPEASKRKLFSMSTVKRGYEDTISIIKPEIDQADEIQAKAEQAVSTRRANQRREPLIV